MDGEQENPTGKLMQLLRLQKYAVAEPLALRIVADAIEATGPVHRQTADAFVNLGVVYAGQEKVGVAIELYKHAVAIYEKCTKPSDPHMRAVKENLEVLLSGDTTLHAISP